MNDDSRLQRILSAQPYPFLFATISGAHLYGFPSPDSDVDMRGAHILPLEAMVGLDTKDETLEDTRVIEGLEMDIVSHDVRKFFGLLLKKNGYVLEQLYSPLIVQTSPQHEELKSICRRCVTRNHSHHYLGFVQTQWNLFTKESPRRVKPLLYVYRVLLTGIWMMRTGEVESNLLTLNESFKLSFIDDLVAQKTGGTEQGALRDNEWEFHHTQFQRLEAELQTAFEASTLPEVPSDKTRAAVNDLLVRIRLQHTPFASDEIPF
jgi:uncharacterized protein